MDVGRLPWLTGLKRLLWLREAIASIDFQAARPVESVRRVSSLMLQCDSRQHLSTSSARAVRIA